MPPTTTQQLSDDFERLSKSALLLPCTFCEAKAGEQCVGMGGLRVGWFHSDRLNAALSAGVEKPR